MVVRESAKEKKSIRKAWHEQTTMNNSLARLIRINNNNKQKRCRFLI